MLFLTDESFQSPIRQGTNGIIRDIQKAVHLWIWQMSWLIIEYNGALMYQE